ncbi:tetratricopeptide repeat protein [Mesonia ostreae]|uniref:Tetratricopeptide repeat protein n=1 Tax=Mesonia ostreae TaxID=861110 RepID=A0ABU2KJH6_9FLAO|nr:tetratricopeptide repeat protein [Mesonia ostreae]MDT0294824.1 tetratricopeptide repeat protein [Mesonia ostreae]
MRFLVTLLFFFIVSVGFSQSSALANNYFDQGEYEKAKAIYQKIYDKNPRDVRNIKQLVATYQELQEYQAAEKILLKELKGNVIYPNLWIDLGYNYQLQNKSDKAEENYQEAIATVKKTTAYAYAVGRSFQQYNLLDEAIITYETALKDKSNANFSVELARIYGEKGKLDKMFESYLKLIEEEPKYLYAIKRNLAEFVNEDKDNEANQILRKTLLLKNQQKPDVMYNALLSWLFTQQKEYQKAFVQERAIYVRSPQKNMRPMFELANLAEEENQLDAAREIFDYLIENEEILSRKVEAQAALLQLEIDHSTPKEYKNIDEKFQRVFTEFAQATPTEIFPIQLQYVKFLAFQQDDKTSALAKLEALLNSRINRYEEAQTKLVKADILVLQEQFNQALIYYSQIQKLLQNSVIAQEATFKIAKTSFYKGDFDWAKTQLKVLKTATSKLIANDALQLHLLINDNMQGIDSTHTALKQFAKADLLAYQNKEVEALAILDKILAENKGLSVEDDALFRKSKILLEQKNFEAAIESLNAILSITPPSIYAARTYFLLAKTYEEELNDPENAKNNYEKIIFEHEDSIYYNEARKKYRQLRGDAIH